MTVGYRPLDNIRIYQNAKKVCQELEKDCESLLGMFDKLMTSNIVKNLEYLTERKVNSVFPE